MRKKTIMAAAILIILSVVVALSLAQKKAKGPGVVSGDRKSLRGLDAVGIEVSTSLDDFSLETLSHKALRRTLELALQEAGIKVVTAKVAEKLPGAPVLELDISANREGTGDRVAFTTRISLVQDVMLKRDATLVARAPTWRSYLMR